jgi:hypothetical protein
MLFSAFILVSIEGEHDGLKEGIDFGQADKTTECCDMARLRLEEEEEVGVLLEFALVWEVTFGRVYLLEMLLDFSLLWWGRQNYKYWMDRERKETNFVESHTILYEESYPLIKVAYIALQDKVLLGLRWDTGFKVS